MPGFEEALRITLQAEGGYVNDPDDRGGATNMGITQVTYWRWQDRQGHPRSDVRDITEEEVETIYREYWNAVQADRLPWPLNAVLFDMAVNHGPQAAVKMLQRVLEVTPDGDVGRYTQAKVRTLDPDSLSDHLLWARVDRYRRLGRGSQLKFLPGWLWRVNHLRDELALSDSSRIEPVEYAD